MDKRSKINESSFSPLIKILMQMKNFTSNKISKAFGEETFEILFQFFILLVLCRINELPVLQLIGCCCE